VWASVYFWKRVQQKNEGSCADCDALIAKRGAAYVCPGCGIMACAKCRDRLKRKGLVVEDLPMGAAEVEEGFEERNEADGLWE